MLRRKGDQKHKIIGNIFVISTLISSFSAIMLGITQLPSLLFIFGVFGLYQIGMGVRYLNSIRRRVKAKRVKWSDWILTVGLAGFSLFLIYLAGIDFLEKDIIGAFTLIVFCALGCFLVYQDVINLNGKSKWANFSLIMHIQRMSGAFIISVAIFLVTNVEFLPGWPLWILPLVAVVPFIVKWTNQYRKMKGTSRLKSLKVEDDDPTE